MSTATDTDPSDAFDIRPTKGESVPSKGMVSFAKYLRPDDIDAIRGYVSGEAKKYKKN